jgi:hypothetical protein
MMTTANILLDEASTMVMMRMMVIMRDEIASCCNVEVDDCDEDVYAIMLTWMKLLILIIIIVAMIIIIIVIVMIMINTMIMMLAIIIIMEKKIPIHMHGQNFTSRDLAMHVEIVASSSSASQRYPYTPFVERSSRPRDPK